MHNNICYLILATETMTLHRWNSPYVWWQTTYGSAAGLGRPAPRHRAAPRGTAGWPEVPSAVGVSDWVGGLKPWLVPAFLNPGWWFGTSLEPVWNMFYLILFVPKRLTFIAFKGVEATKQIWFYDVLFYSRCSDNSRKFKVICDMLMIYNRTSHSPAKKVMIQ